jgi:flagellar motor protein MotB
MPSPIGQHNAGYRQGVVLGLTMAEALLLLVFVLLLVTGGMVERLRIENKLQMAANEELEQRLRKNSDFRKELERFEGIKATPEDLRAAIAVIETLRKVAGKSPESMIEAIEAFAKQVKAGAPEIPRDWQKLVRAEEQMRVLGELLKKKGYVVDPSKSLNDIIQANVRDAGQDKSNDWPPMIRLSEADGHYFSLGKAGLSPEFEAYLIKEVVPALVERIKKYDVDVIEVVGHTDQVPMNGLPSTLDADLRDALVGIVPVDNLVPGDNAGLGIARAVAVARVLLNDNRLNGIQILPLSGAQLTTLDERLDTDPKGDANVRERRRIEIRMRRSIQAQTLSADQ